MKKLNICICKVVILFIISCYSSYNVTGDIQDASRYSMLSSDSILVSQTDIDISNFRNDVALKGNLMNIVSIAREKLGQQDWIDAFMVEKVGFPEGMQVYADEILHDKTSNEVIVPFSRNGWIRINWWSDFCGGCSCS